MDELLARMAGNDTSLKNLSQDVLALQAAIADQQKIIKQLQAGSEKTDVAGPVVENFTASFKETVVPGMLLLSVQASDAGSGVLKVEFWEAGKSEPVAVDSTPPYEATVALSVQDAGSHTYYVRAYDMAANAAGAVAPNISSNAETPLRVEVNIPANTLDAKGSLKADFNQDTWVKSLRSDPHHDGVYFALTSSGTDGDLLKVDYAGKSAARVGNGGFQTRDLVFHPGKPDTVFWLATDPQLYSSSILQISSDAGQTWKEVARNAYPYYYGYGLDGQLDYGVRYLAMAPSGKKLLAYNHHPSTWNGGNSWSWAVGFSEDDGVTWTGSQYDGYYMNSAIGPVAVAASDENVVYAATGGSSTMLKSTDGGRNFSSLTALPTSSPAGYYDGVEFSVDPFNANVVLAIPQISSYGASPKIYRSTDGGTTWAAVQWPETALVKYLLANWGGVSLRGVAHNPYVKGLVYAPVFTGIDNGAVLRSKDGGLTWELLSYFNPKATAAMNDYRYPASWVLSTKPDADGAVQVFLPTSNGFNRFLDTTALK